MLLSTYSFGPIDAECFEVGVEEEVVETEEDCPDKAEGDDQQEPVLSAGEGWRATRHAQKSQDLKDQIHISSTHSIQYKGFLKCVQYWKTLKITKIFSTDDHYHDPYLKMKFFPNIITVLCYSAKIVSNSVLYFTLGRVIIS